MKKVHGFLESLVSWLKPYVYEYWSGHPCLLGVAGPNVAGIAIIKAENVHETALHAR